MVRIGGPRGIASDGEKLVIGAYQPQQAYVWNEFPETSGVPADFILAPKGQEDEPPMGVMGVDIEDGKLYAASSHHIFVWDSFPIRDKQEPDKKLGKQMVREESLILRDSYLFHKDTFNSPYDVEIIGNKMVVADTNKNPVIICICNNHFIAYNFNIIRKIESIFMEQIAIGEYQRFLTNHLLA